MMTQWEELADEQTIQKTIKSPWQKGIEALVVGDGEEAKKAVLAMIPEGAEVMTMSSTTLDTICVWRG